MFFKYTLPRLFRRFTPAPLFQLLLRQQWLVRPGAETRVPKTAFERYQAAITQAGETLRGQRVMVFGFGGNFALGCMLLRAGATHVVLCDKYAIPDDRCNKELLPEYNDFLEAKGTHIAPRPAYMSVLQADVRQLASQGTAAPFDLVISTSVFEHLDDVDGITHALALLTKPGGFQLHYINLKDHLFKYPFQMLTYSAEHWRKWLNPPSNLNRYRFADFQQIFERHFERVEIAILDRNLAEFIRLKSKIRPEFLTGDDEIDAATRLQVLAFKPKTGLTKPQ
jgi:hypothetical protein